MIWRRDVQVTELWRYPVKSMQGERVDAVDLTSWGLAGDRRWALFDLDTGFGLTARRSPELLHASARLRADDVEITLPDGTVAGDDAALSAWLGKRVALRATSEVGPRQYENPDDIETEAEGSWQPFDGTGHAFHDGYTVTLLSAGTIGDRPMRRFRPNIVVDADEDELVGRSVRVGDAVVDVTDRVSRCVMVTRSQPGGIEIDRDVLRWIHRQRDGELAVGGPVLRSGGVQVGDPVTPV
jgi:uncharacterized protein